MSFSILVVLVIDTAIVIAAIWWFFPVWQRRRQDVRLTSGSTLTAKDLAELEDAYRKTCTQALGSIVVLLTVVIAYMQLKQTEMNSGRQIEETARKTALDNSNVQLAKGYELIGANTAAQRAGGIHLLMQWAERTMDETERNLRLDLVAKTLVNLVRDRTHFEKGQPFSESCEVFETARPASSMIGSDIQQALDGLVRISQVMPVSINFHGLNLSRAKLADAKFKDANFAFADLSDVEFKDADLRDSNFYCSNMFRAKFSGADLTGTSLSERGPQTNMAGALLFAASFSKGSKPASLKGVNLVSAVLDRAVIEDVDMSGANLDNAKLFQTRLVRASLDGTIIDNACFINAEMVETTLKNAKVVNAPVVVSTAGDLSLESHCSKHLSRPLPQ
jgi:uncharacterized protein YjbI with pentapeptide repeats